MIKVVIPEIVQEVGTTGALLLQHINYWMFTQTKDKIFRTNNELVQDLNGMFTLFQIQYAKKKLIEKGFLVISFDKKFDRVTHYTFTEKAIALLEKHTSYLSKRSKPSNNVQVRRGVSKDLDAMIVPLTKTIPETQAYDGFDSIPKLPIQQTSKGMKKCFETHGQVRDTVVRSIPDSLKHLLRGKKEETKVELIPLNEEDVAGHLAAETLLSESVFSRIPNVEGFEKIRRMKEDYFNFNEDV